MPDEKVVVEFALYYLTIKFIGKTFLLSIIEIGGRPTLHCKQHVVFFILRVV